MNQEQEQLGQEDQEENQPFTLTEHLVYFLLQAITSIITFAWVIFLILTFKYWFPIAIVLFVVIYANDLRNRKT